MGIASWLRPRRDSSSILGWVLILWNVVKLVWKGAEAMDVASFLLTQGANIGIFLASGWGTLVTVGLGVALIIWSNRRHSRVGKPLIVQEPIPKIDSADSTFIDALQHVLVQGQRHIDLTIQKACSPWRILYPIFIRNTRAIAIDIIGFNLTILWNDIEVHRVTWRTPEGETSDGISLRPNGERIEAFRVQPDDERRLDIPWNGVQMSNLPLYSPIWHGRGTLFLRSGTQERELQFNFNTDRYRLEEGDWQGWRKQLGL